MRKNPFTAIFLAICLLLLGTSWSLAGEIKAQDGKEIAVYTPQASPESINTFWTKERMFQALQNPLTKEVSTEDLKLTLDAAEPAGEPKSSPALLPGLSRPTKATMAAWASPRQALRLARPARPPGIVLGV
jgi:hypothetical protein